MAPSKSSSKKVTTSNAGPLKQGVLGFTSAKRTASSASAKGKKAPTRTNSTPVITSTKRRESTSDEDSISSISSKEEHSDRDRISSEDDNTRRAPPKTRNNAKSPTKAVSEIREPLSLDLQDKEGRWNQYYGIVRQKMGNLKPVHGENQTKVHHILRVFDLSYEYGPCIGVTRLERWERAEALGMNPPKEVKEILSAKEAIERDEFSQCVLYGEV